MIMNVNFRTLERDRVEADFTVNKLVIEKERRREGGGGRESYLENWRGISFRRNLRIVEYGLNFHISSLVTRLSYLSASTNSLIILSSKFEQTTR